MSRGHLLPSVLAALCAALAVRGLLFVGCPGEPPRGHPLTREAPAIARSARSQKDERDAVGAVELEKKPKPSAEAPEGEAAEKSRRGPGSWQWKPSGKHAEIHEGSSAKEMSAMDREALRLPPVDEAEEERKLMEKEDREFLVSLGPFGGWILENAQPRKWGPHGMLAFKLMYLAFMWYFMMKAYPVILDILFASVWKSW